MKKLLIVLAILLVAGAGAFAQDVTVGGQARFGLIANSTGGTFSSGGSVQGSGEEVVISASVDDNTSATLKFQVDPTTGYGVDQISASSNVFGALGLDLPVSLNLTVGYFDTYFTNWSYVSRSGKEFYYPGAAWSGDPGATGIFLMNVTQPTANLAWMWQIGFGDFALKYWNSWDFGQMAVAFSGNVSVLSFVAGFSADYADIANTGTVYVEAAGNVDLGAASLFIPATFGYNLAGAWNWSSGVKAGIMDMITVSVGVGGDSTTAFRYILPEISAQPIDGLDVYAIAEIDLADASAFNSVDVGAAYQVGAMEINPGVVIALDDTLYTSIANDGYWFQGTGVYVDFTVSY